MASFTGVSLSGSSNEEITDALIGLNRSLDYQMANLDSENVREIGGWRVGPKQLTSKDMDVGMSTDDSQAENVRFWAGSAASTAAPFRVYDSGRVVASNMQITGGNITWGNVVAPDYTQIMGYKPPADANNTYSELLYNSGIRGFVNVGGTLYLSADYIYAGTITGITIRTGSAGNRVVMDAGGLHSHDSAGVQRIAILNTDVGETPNTTLGFYNGSGTRLGVMNANSNTFKVYGNRSMLFGAADGIVLASNTAYFDFMNVPIQNFNATAKFG